MYAFLTVKYQVMKIALPVLPTVSYSIQVELNFWAAGIKTYHFLQPLFLSLLINPTPILASVKAIKLSESNMMCP